MPNSSMFVLPETAYLAFVLLEIVLLEIGIASFASLTTQASNGLLYPERIPDAHVVGDVAVAMLSFTANLISKLSCSSASGCALAFPEPGCFPPFRRKG